MPELDAQQMLDQIAGEETKIQEVEDLEVLEVRGAKTTEDIEELTKLREELTIAEEVGNVDEISRVSKILNSTLESLQESTKSERENFAGLMLQLDKEIAGIDGTIVGLTDLSPSEKALITNAEKTLKVAEDSLVVANTRMSLFGFRARAVKEANTNIKNAKKVLEAAKQKAKDLQNDRLQNATLDDSYQDLTVLVDRIKTRLETRIEGVKNELKSVTEGKRDFQQKHHNAVALMEKLDDELNKKENTDLVTEEGKLVSLTGGSKEYSAQEIVVSKLKAEIEELRGQRNIAASLAGECEKFAKRFEIDEAAHIKLRDNLDMWKKILKTANEARLKTFPSLLEAMKAHADQLIARKIDEVAVVADQRGAEMMAQIQVASDKARMERMEKYPEIIRNMFEVYEDQMQHSADMMQREEEFLAEVRDKYGIDQSKSSFFTYMKKDEAKTE